MQQGTQGASATSGALAGRTVIITGAGRGVGREHALLYAREGANVVVNDLGGTPSGGGGDPRPGEEVAEEIRAAGGQAVANFGNIANVKEAEEMVDQAVDSFGGLDVLVNNAGIIRDRMLVNMSEEEWDAVIAVHLKGHFATTRAAARYWRGQHKSGKNVKASVVNTSSTSGLFGTVGQSNYGAAKAGIASFSMIAANELGRYGVRVNAIAPVARTRLTPEGSATATPLAEQNSSFDLYDPANVSPFVAYLGTEDCPISGRVFFVVGGEVHLFEPWSIIDGVTTDHRWEVAELQQAAARLADVPFELGDEIRRNRATGATA